MSHARRTLRMLRLVLPALGLVACQHLGGLGHVSPSLVDLYDMGAEDGMMEIEFERDGSIVEMEADVDPADLPQFVVDAAMARLPGATITGGEREIQAAGSAWEVKLRYEGRDWELVVDDAGTIQETEKELTPQEAPPAVLEMAEFAVPGSTFKSVEVIENAAGTQYHVKRTRGGASYKIVLAADGTVLRKVREARAEIEIPLAD